MGRMLTLRRSLARLLTRDEVDDNFVAIATDFAGAEDPASLEGAHVVPFMRWADTGTGWLRRRNIANNSWVNEQRLHRPSLAIFGAEEVPAQDVGPICIAGEGYAEWNNGTGGYASQLGALWDGSTFNLSGGRFILGNFDGLHTSDTLSFRQSQPSTSVTYLPVVPPEGGSAAFTIHRSAADLNSKFLAMGVDGHTNFADITFSRHGNAEPPSALRFVSAYTECGRVFADGTWTIGQNAPAVGAYAQARIHFAGFSAQWGILMCPRANDGAAIAFQNAAGHLVGTITTSATNTAYNINSDYRLKNVTGNADPAEALARIMKVSIREFTWKLDGRKDRGVIAHELAESHPNAVTGEKDAMVDMPGYPDSILPQSVDYSKLVPDLVAAIQAQQKTIEHLESQLVRLNANHGAG